MTYASLCYAGYNIANISENSYILTELSCLELDVPSLLRGKTTLPMFNRVLISSKYLVVWLQVALFYLGDDDIMHGVLAAEVRNNMDAVFVVFLID